MFNYDFARRKGTKEKVKITLNEGQTDTKNQMFQQLLATPLVISVVKLVMKPSFLKNGTMGKFKKRKLICYRN